MPLIPQDQLTGPQFGSIGIAGAPKTGKTQSLWTLHRFLKNHKLPTRMAIFDLDEDGAEPLIRIARDGVRDEKRNLLYAGGWSNDLDVYRYNVKGNKINPAEVPTRTRIPTEMFINESAALYDRLDSVTGRWKPSMELGAVVCDSMTALNERWFDYVMTARHKEVGGTKAAGNEITFNEWTMIKSKILETVRSFKALPCYSVFMFHEILLQEEVPGPKPEDTKTTGMMYWVPKVTGDLTTTIQKEFSVFVHSTVKDGKYLWIAQPTSRIRSVGSRGKELMPTEVGQDFENILTV
jgi:hypothetical protein